MRHEGSKLQSVRKTLDMPWMAMAGAQITNHVSTSCTFSHLSGGKDISKARVLLVAVLRCARP